MERAKTVPILVRPSRKLVVFFISGIHKAAHFAIIMPPLSACRLGFNAWGILSEGRITNLANGGNQNDR